MEALAGAFQDPGTVTKEEIGAVAKALGKPLEDDVCARIAKYCTSEVVLEPSSDRIMVPVGDRKEGESPIFRHYKVTDKVWTTPADAGYPDVQTMADLWNINAHKFASLNLMEIPDQSSPADATTYTKRTYADVAASVDAFGRGLIKVCDFGLPPQAFVGVHLKTGPEWQILQLAAYKHNFVPATMYDSLGKDGIKYVMNITGAAVLVTTPTAMPNHAELLASDGCAIKLVVCVGSDDEVAEAAAAAPSTVRVVSFKAVCDAGAGEPPMDPSRVPKAEDLCVLCFTSGTTGVPKGAMTSHRSQVMTTVSAMRWFPVLDMLNIGTGPEDPIKPRYRHLSFLPMAHIMEQFIVNMVIALGGTLGYLRGSVFGLADDIKSFHPTVLITAPRVLNRFYSKMAAGLEAAKADPKKKAVIELAFKTKEAVLARTGRHRSPWDHLLFSGMRDAFGGNMSVIVSGSAPIAPDVQQFLRIATGAQVFEGYGMTEILVMCSPPQGWTHKLKRSIGGIWPCVEAKVVDVPEMGYINTDDTHCGELLIRGSTLLKAYYKADDITKDAHTADGFFKTGDIVRVGPNGELCIVDRAKALFKLSQGEYVAPEKVEGVVARVPGVLQVFIHGVSDWDSTVAVIVPDPESPVEADLPAIAAFCRKDGLSGFEIPGAIVKAPGTFESLGLLTPTMKMIRHAAAKMFGEEMTKAYEEALAVRKAAGSPVVVPPKA